MNSEYQIRDLELGDLKELVILCKSHAQYENSTYNPENKVELLNILFEEDSPFKCLVVEKDEKLLGTQYL